MTTTLPRIGQWYRHLDKGEAFLVTGYDERTGTTEIQSFGGDLDEIDPDAWSQLFIVPTEPPEDWTGPIDNVPHDDLGYSDTAMKGSDWEAPLQALLPAVGEAWESTVDGSDDPLEVQEILNEDLTADNAVARDLARRNARTTGERP
jgi:hypothetical protein